MTVPPSRCPARLLAALLLVLAAGPALAAGPVETFTGTARLADGSVYYVERHRIEWSGDRPLANDTRYYDAGGAAFGELESRFTPGSGAPYAPAYRFEDRRLGRSDRLEIRDGTADTRAEAGDGSPARIGHYPLAPDLVTGQGLHFLLRDRLAGFVTHPDAEVNARLLVPLDDAIYPVRVRRLAYDGQHLVLRIEVDHWLYRLFAPHMDIAYDVPSRRLVWYEGPTHILDAQRGVRSVRIDYRYGSDAATAAPTAAGGSQPASGRATSMASGRWSE